MRAGAQSRLNDALETDILKVSSGGSIVYSTQGNSWLVSGNTKVACESALNY